MCFEAADMAYSASMDASQLYVHNHVLRRRQTLMDSKLPKKDKDRLNVLPIGGNDLFGPKAGSVEEWKKDPTEEQGKQMARGMSEIFNKYISSRPESSAQKSNQDFKHPASGRRASLEQRSPLMDVDRQYQNQNNQANRRDYNYRPPRSPRGRDRGRGRNNQNRGGQNENRRSDYRDRSSDRSSERDRQRSRDSSRDSPRGRNRGQSRNSRARNNRP